MNTWAAPGVRCVCVDDSFAPDVPRPWPVEGRTYTISAVWDYPWVGVHISLAEVAENPNHDTYGLGWAIERFRPVVGRKTDISGIKALLEPVGGQREEESV